MYTKEYDPRSQTWGIVYLDMVIASLDSEDEVDCLLTHLNRG